MTADEIIDAYVGDVARHLPGRMRRDVALELRDLLTESLSDRAEAAGRAPDEALALEHVRAFGTPAAAAARYHQPFALIDPSETRLFILIALIGIGAAGVIREIANAYSHARFELPSINALLGILLTIFAVKNFIVRTVPPEAFNARGAVALRFHARMLPWSPPKSDLKVSTPLQAIVYVALTGVFLIAYLSPGWFMGHLYFGQPLHLDYSYTDSFRHWTRMAWIPILTVIQCGLVLTAAIRKGWTQQLALSSIFVQIIMILQLGWHLRYGDIFVDHHVEAMVRPIMAIVAFFWTLEVAFMIYREIGRITPAKPYAA